MSKGQFKRKTDMGLAASQARLLSLTARIHDVEYQAQMIQSAKLQLAMQEDEAYRKYNDALDAQTLTFQNLNGDRVKASFYNLCGLGSIDNNIATDKSYVFRDGGDRLIVPSEIYEGYKNFGGTDPYSFAMYMTCGQDNLLGDVNEAEKTFFESIDKEHDDTYGTYKDKILSMLENVFKYTTCKDDTDEGEEKHKTNDLNDMAESLLCFGYGDFEDRFFEGSIPKEAEKGIESLKKVVDEYKYKLHIRDGKTLYYQLTMDSEENYNGDKFNYYLKWAKLIEQEVGIEYCTCASDYNTSFDIEKDEEALNQMLQSGKISIDMVYLSKNGEVSDKPTSAGSDSNIAMTNKSSIDSTELKRAEAEYEKTMRDVQRKDKRYDMDLNKLETERTALTTEYDSVKKVIQDNIERTFGIFS